MLLLPARLPSPASPTQIQARGVNSSLTTDRNQKVPGLVKSCKAYTNLSADSSLQSWGAMGSATENSHSQLRTVIHLLRTVILNKKKKKEDYISL